MIVQRGGRKLILTAVQTRPTLRTRQNSAGFRRAPVGLYERMPAPFFPSHMSGQAELRSSSMRPSRRSSHSRFQRRGWCPAPTPVSAIEITLHILCDGFPEFGYFDDQKTRNSFHAVTLATTNSIETADSRAMRLTAPADRAAASLPPMSTSSSQRSSSGHPISRSVRTPAPPAPTFANPLQPPDFHPSVPTLAFLQGSCFRLGQAYGSAGFRTTRRNWLRFQKNGFV